MNPRTVAFGLAAAGMTAVMSNGPAPVDAKSLPPTSTLVLTAACPRPATSLPASLALRVTYMPAGFAESNNAQGVDFSTGSNCTSSSWAPRLFRAWIRPTAAGRPEFIIAIVDPAGPIDASTSPSSLQGFRLDLTMTPRTKVYVSTSHGWDIRWTERNLNVQVVVQAPTVSSGSVRKLVAGVRLS